MRSVQALPDQSLPWAISWDGVEMIAMREGLELVAYQCQAGVWTYKWGETSGVREGMTCTKQEADQTLCDEIAHYVEGVKRMCTVTPNINQLAGLVSLAYNIGLGAPNDPKRRGLLYTTVLAQHNRGDFNAAARAFALLNQYRDPVTKELKVSNGLTIRRKQESALYLTPIPNEVGAVSEDMPQAVEPESSPAKSPINLGSITAVGGAAVPLLSSLGDQADKANTAVTQITTTTHSVKGLLAEFDLTPVEVFCPLAIVGACVAMWYRRKQRTGGWA